MKTPNVFIEETSFRAERIAFNPAETIKDTLEKSFEWVAFEENTPQLWTEIKAVTEDYLMQVWRAGKLCGTSVKEAFLVRCDSSTMSQNDIDHHIVVLLVGTAAIKPGEFDILRIEIKAA